MRRFKRLSSVGVFLWSLSMCIACSKTEVSKDVLSNIPKAYDPRQERVLTPVDDQGNFGTCWAFASTAALEMGTSIEEGLEFSVDHMTMNHGFNGSPSDGGDYNMAIAYLSAWQGPVSEREDPYGDGRTDSTLKAVKHLQEVQILKEKDLDEIKKYILTYGGLESPIYMSISHVEDASEDYNAANAAYYYSGDQKANHDVVIVGWDDSFSRENFSNMPNSDGAFICRNSWGEAFGEDGYFYVSYEDEVLGRQAIAYTKLEEPDNYSRIYQSDMLGWVGTLGFGEDTSWFANVYTSENDETLCAVSFYAVDDETSYEVYVVENFTDPKDLSEGICMASGYVENCGYYTVDLSNAVELLKGQTFAIAIRIHTEDTERPIAIEYAATELTKDVVLTDGQGYISHDGKQWVSSEQEYECNVCLKAFTMERR